MNIQAGQWYRCRCENFLAHVIGTVQEEFFPFVCVLYSEGKYYCLSRVTRDGLVFVNGIADVDLIEHLPGCDGPNWRQKRWREAKPEDAVKGVQCRAANKDGKLVGFQNIDDKTYFYVKTHDGRYSWFPSFNVEVLE